MTDLAELTERARSLGIFEPDEHAPPPSLAHTQRSTEDAEALAECVAALDRREPWRRDALCREHQDLNWYLSPLPLAERAVCGRCAVRRESLVVAFRDDLDGVWGGLNRRERRAYQRAGLGADEVLAGREPPTRAARKPLLQPSRNRSAPVAKAATPSSHQVRPADA